jgi:inner membrane protein
VASDGFEARWQSGWFARGFPAAWVRGAEDDRALKARADASAIGVDLVQPVDVYQQAERAVKYAALFIVLTLAVAFLREITSRLAVHPVQYLFIGFGLCLFYLLLVSLAEHVRFVVAYLVASSATVLLLAWYWSGVLRSWRAGVSMGLALTGLYGYLYLLLRLEDLALVAGATGLFVMLAVIMAMTRHVDWFSLRIADAAPWTRES